MHEAFRKFAQKFAEAIGTPAAFCVALLGVLAWVICGFFIGFSNTIYQLAINTVTTIVTFLAIFLIQNTQNRDAKALHLKLDELLRATETARNSLVNIETLSDEELVRLQKHFERVQKAAQASAVHDELEERASRPPASVEKLPASPEGPTPALERLKPVVRYEAPLPSYPPIDSPPPLAEPKLLPGRPVVPPRYPRLPSTHPTPHSGAPAIRARFISTSPLSESSETMVGLFGKQDVEKKT